MPLFVTQFSSIGQDAFGSGKILYGRPGTNEEVSVGASSTQSAAFDKETSLISVYADQAVHIDIGPNPTANNTGGSETMRLPASERLEFAVPQGGDWKIAVIQD